jgi:hypothetical protein
LDAYIFATEATEEAVSTLGAGAEDSGPARVVVPLLASPALYVAVQASTAVALGAAVTAVVGTTGVAGVTAYLASSLGTPFALPTYAQVDAFLGFALLETLPGLSVSVRNAATEVTGVTGVAVVLGVCHSVLVEVTGPDTDAVAAMLATVTGLSGVRAYTTAVGASDLGFGLTRME